MGRNRRGRANLMKFMLHFSSELSIKKWLLFFITSKENKPQNNLIFNTIKEAKNILIALKNTIRLSADILIASADTIRIFTNGSVQVYLPEKSLIQHSILFVTSTLHACLFLQSLLDASPQSDQHDEWCLGGV